MGERSWRSGHRDRSSSKRIAKKKAKQLRAAAYDAFDDNQLDDALAHFEALALLDANDPQLHYMCGLASKYLRRWDASLAHNLKSLELRDEVDESSVWNAAIAASALAQHDEARRLWALCGYELPGDAGPIEGDFGLCCIRLNPWGEGETLFAQRIDLGTL